MSTVNRPATRGKRKVRAKSETPATPTPAAPTPAVAEPSKLPPIRVGDLVGIDNDCGVYQVVHVDGDACVLDPLADMMERTTEPNAGRFGWQTRQTFAIPWPRLPAPGTTAAALAHDAAKWLREFTDANERTFPGRLALLAELGREVAAKMDRDEVMGQFPTPTRAERHNQVEVLGKAALHLAAFRSMMETLDEFGGTVRWCDSWPALELAFLSKLLDDRLRLFVVDFIAQVGTVDAMEQEVAITNRNEAVSR